MSTRIDTILDVIDAGLATHEHLCTIGSTGTTTTPTGAGKADAFVSAFDAGEVEWVNDVLTPVSTGREASNG